MNGDGTYKLLLDGKTVVDRGGNPDMHRKETSGTALLTRGDHGVMVEYRHSGGETGLVWSWSPPATSDSLAVLKDADLVVAVLGIGQDYEWEGKDRTTLSLPSEQEQYMDQALAQNPRTVAVLENGSPLAVSSLKNKVPAILEAWYPGEEGGDAIADVLFGDYNPAGRLPLTFYASDAQLRPKDEYDLTKGRTYMYFRDKPLYPFGYGLSYTSFTYANLELSRAAASTNDKINVMVDVTNTGPRTGDEVVQCYVHARSASVPMPIKQMWAFKRVTLAKGETETVSMDLETKNFGHWDQLSQSLLVEPGTFDILVGASSDDIRQSTAVVISGF